MTTNLEISAQCAMSWLFFVTSHIYTANMAYIRRGLLCSYSFPACLALFGKNQSIYLRCNEGVTPVTG